MPLLLLLLPLLFFVSSPFSFVSASSSSMYLLGINTGVRCHETRDCQRHFNYSWCMGSATICMRETCIRIANYPCKSTELCLEDVRLCTEKQCDYDSDCDNYDLCDGREICGPHYRCIEDPLVGGCHSLHNAWCDCTITTSIKRTQGNTSSSSPLSSYYSGKRDNVANTNTVTILASLVAFFVVAYSIYVLTLSCTRKTFKK